MCKDDRLQAQGVSNIVHALATMCACGVLSTESPAVFAALTALEQRTRGVAVQMTSQAVANTVWGFATLKWELGSDAWDALEAGIVRLGPCDMNAQEVANSTWGFATMSWELGDEAWLALDKAAARTAADMNPQAMANTLWGYATLGRPPAPGTMAALESAVVRLGKAMNTQDVVNLLWSYVTLEVDMGAKPRAALESAVSRLGPRMNSQDVASVVWAFSALRGPAPGKQAFAALEAAEMRLSPVMSAQDVSAAMLGYATAAQHRTPGARAWAALETAVVREAPLMGPQDVSNTMWGYAALGRIPRGNALDALESAAVRNGPSMDPQHVAHTVSAYAKLGCPPSAAACAALDTAAARVASSMNAQNVANTLWSFLSLAAIRDVPLPLCYPLLWRAARDLDTRSLLPVNWCNFFHAYLIHSELLAGGVGLSHGQATSSRGDGGGGAGGASGGLVDDETGNTMLSSAIFPSWIMHEAREEWMRNVFDDVDVSRMHAEVAVVLADLGIAHEMECLTDDEYFSLDLYLLDYDLALEVDGPAHFVKINADEGGSGGGGGGGSKGSSESTATTGTPQTYRRTPSTELRDMFLRRRHRGMVTVPWYEFEALEGTARRREYMTAKLRAAGVDDLM